MSSLAIVAIPSEDNYVYKISSEKVPHLTLLFLGDDATKVKNLDKIIDFVGHAANTSLRRFGIEVDRRTTLGPEEADVLLFSTSKWSGIEEVKKYRSYLLQEPNIRTAYDSATQFPEWQPHLTLGYPATPAKPDQRDWPGITYVNFDRVAVWFGDYEGVEFPLKPHGWDTDLDMAMSGLNKQMTEDVLEHVGVKGMKWGVRKDQSSSVTISDRGKKLRTSGGRNLPSHPDAIRARMLGQKGKASGLKALSDDELRVYANRLQLEQNVKRLNYNEMNMGKKFVANVLGKSGNALASEGVNKGVKEVGKRTLKLATG